MKSIKNKVEINNTIKSHIYDGVAVTKFLYWIKKNQNKKISEIDAEKNWSLLEKNKIIFFQASTQYRRLERMVQLFITVPQTRHAER